LKIVKLCELILLFYPQVGIIGGSGLDNPDILENRREEFVDTIFGKPSDALIHGTIAGVDCVLLARHNRAHNISPTNINYRANIWALKEAGCTVILASMACGSLQEEVRPGDLIFIDQFIDRTTHRQQTFYDGVTPGAPQGICHIPMDTSYHPKVRALLMEVATELGIHFHPAGTVVVIEGSRYSSMAESRMYKSWGAHVINMTTVPEVILAKEAGLLYATIGMATDYDCWREEEESVAADSVVKVFKENAAKVIKLFRASVQKIAALDWTHDINTLKSAIQSGTMVA